MGITRVHALGRKRQVEVHTGRKALRGQNRLHHFDGRPRIRRRFQDDELALLEHRRHGIDRLHDVGHVGVLGLAQWRRHADVDDVGRSQRLRIRRRLELAVLHDLGQVLGGHVGNVAAPRQEFRDLVRVDVVADDGEPGTRELHGQRQADIAQSDDAQGGLLRVDLLQQFHKSYPR